MLYPEQHSVPTDVDEIRLSLVDDSILFEDAFVEKNTLLRVVLALTG